MTEQDKWRNSNLEMLNKMQTAQTLFVNNFTAIASQFRRLFPRIVSWF